MTIHCCACGEEIPHGERGYFKENSFNAILFFCSETCYDKEAKK